MRNNTLALISLAAALVATVGLAGPARGQEPPRSDLTSALFGEIRGLRVAIERLASSNARIQLAIGRLQIQEQRVNTLLRQHAEVRQKLADAERQQSEAEARLADLQGVVGTIADSGERQAVAQEIGVLKALVSAGNTALQKLRSDDAELAGVASIEQGRWTAINQELDSLDQALQRP